MRNFVGCVTMELVDHELGLTFPMLVLYPTDTPGRVEHLGPFPLEVALDAPAREGRFPVVLISHGSGGTHLGYRTLAHYLAQHGFIVGSPEHPFNNRHDNRWQGTVENLRARPRHLRLAIDGLVEGPRFAKAVRPDAVALIGHSMGGHTALALAGGVPTSFAREALNGRPQQVATAPDGRVKALVLLAPAAVWFREAGALRGVHVPILMLAAEHDEFTPAFHAQLVLDGVGNRAGLEYRVVPNAGHFSFLSPFPAAMNNPAFPPSQDPPGFDRARFHRELNTEVLAFLRRTLS